MTDHAVPATSQESPPVPRVALTDDNGRLEIEIKDTWGHLVTPGSATEVARWIVMQLAELGGRSLSINEEDTNCAIAFISEMRPRDPAELLLLTQMTAVHLATMEMATRLNLSTSVVLQDASERALNKLARTFAGQIETLKRYRSKGTQVVHVESVSVEGGGQAIVGNVTGVGGRTNDEK